MSIPPPGRSGSRTLSTFRQNSQAVAHGPPTYDPRVYSDRFVPFSPSAVVVAVTRDRRKDAPTRLSRGGGYSVTATGALLFPQSLCESFAARRCSLDQTVHLLTASSRSPPRLGAAAAKKAAILTKLEPASDPSSSEAAIRF